MTSSPMTKRSMAKEVRTTMTVTVSQHDFMIVKAHKIAFQCFQSDIVIIRAKVMMTLIIFPIIRIVITKIKLHKCINFSASFSFRTPAVSEGNLTFYNIGQIIW